MKNEEMFIQFKIQQNSDQLIEIVYAIEELAAEFIVWPDQERKVEIRSWFRKHKCFPNAIGAVDGVPFPFDAALEYETKAWNTRKMEYAMGATGVCDHKGLFTYFSADYVGSMHDSQAYKNIDLYHNVAQYFQGEDYLLADAAYVLSTTLIPRYSNAIGDQLEFNTLHGSARVKIEHALIC